MSNIIELARTVLKTTPGRFLAMAESLPPDLLTRQPQPGEWSALECLLHLVQLEDQIFAFRVQALLDGEESFPAFNPDAEGAKLSADSDPVALVQEFARKREASFKVLDKVTPADLGNSAIHSQLGRVTLEELLNEWAAHDLNHLVQAERALMQPFIAGCGPWKPYFADHAVGGG